ncbi:1,2-epoxyphenylacetyl-CoA isomerase [compost metagenome]
MSAPLIVDVAEHIAHIRFNRPKALNALNVELAEAFAQTCQTLADDPDVRVVVLSGMGKVFMAGGDLQALRAAPVEAANQLIGPVHQAVRSLTQMAKPVIASVHGAAAGAGMSVALACDLIIASRGTRFNYAYSDIGTCCDAGISWSLPRAVGLHKALEIAFLSDVIDADQALALGLVNQVVAPDELDDVTRECARRLAARDAFALAKIKSLMRSAHTQPLSTQLDAEHAAFVACARRPEFIQSIDDFYASRSAPRQSQES